jgi:LuxR family maltose regulon positive regulatory protein
LLAGQRFPPIGDLYSLKGALLLEENRLAEAEQALKQGLSLLHLTGEHEARVRCHSAMARLHAIRGDRTAMLDSIQALELLGSQAALYAQALRHRLSLRGQVTNQAGLEQAQNWVTQAGFKFSTLPGIERLDLVSRIHFQIHLSAAHILTRLVARDPQAYSLGDVQNYFDRQEKFASAHGLYGWLIEIWIVRALMDHVQGRATDAHDRIQAALRASAPRGYLRVYLDEGDLMRPLLESVESRLQDNGLSSYVKRLLDAMPREPARGKTERVEEGLSDRELQVLGLLAAGQTYKEIGQQLFLSLNTVQFHVKNIYGKLQVNKRGQAVDKARARKLIPA